MQTLDPPILFDRQDHQEKCIGKIMDALEESPDGHTLNVRADSDFHRAFPRKPGENRLDVLMATGTGKTYVYLKAIFEMHKRFGKTKFIIIVPRTSIKLGVAQSIRQTANHFQSRYGKRLRCVKYPEDGGLDGVLGGFIHTNDLSVLLTTNSSFNNKDNLVNKRNIETLDGGTTVWKEIAGLAPVVVMDEPHLLAGKRTVEYLERLRAGSLFIRFGASYPDNGEHGAANVVYALDTSSALSGRLVKRIHADVVDSSTEEESIRVVDATSRKNFTITYAINGQRHKKIVKYDEDIFAVTGLAQYRGRRATSIGSKEVVLNNDTRLQVGARLLSDDEIRHMIRHTIDLHFEREEKMFLMGDQDAVTVLYPERPGFQERVSENQAHV